MLKIGLTGGIGSGKTSVAAMFQVLHIPVFDADHNAKLIMEKDEQLIESIKQTFGEESYTKGSLNRPYLANIVFNDPFKLDLLNAIVHPVTIKAANNWIVNQTSPYVIKEAALMFEAGSAVHLDFIIGVTAPKPLRIKRVMDRDQVSKEQVLARMTRQIDDNIKMKLCDFIIYNDEQQMIIPQVLALHQKFLAMAKA